MKNADEVETLLGLPVIGAIPRVDELQRSRRRARRAAGPGEAREGGLLHRLKVETPLGLEFRRIYLKLAKARSRPLPSTIVITSSTRGEGRDDDVRVSRYHVRARADRQGAACRLRSSQSGVASRARAPEQQLGARADARTPGLRRALHPFDRASEPRLPGRGQSERPASELVNSDSVEWFIREARARYPLVLIDSAPNLAVPDPLILGRAVEGVLYVIKAGQTVRKAAEYG